MTLVISYFNKLRNFIYRVRKQFGQKKYAFSFTIRPIAVKTYLHFCKPFFLAKICCVVVVPC